MPHSVHTHHSCLDPWHVVDAWKIFVEWMNEHSSQQKPRADWQGFPAAGNLRESSRANSEGQLLLLPWGVSHSPGKSDASSYSYLCLRVQATLVLNARRKEETGVNLFCHDYSFCLSFVLSQTHNGPFPLLRETYPLGSGVCRRHPDGEKPDCDISSKVCFPTVDSTPWQVDNTLRTRKRHIKLRVPRPFLENLIGLAWGAYMWTGLCRTEAARLR